MFDTSLKRVLYKILLDYFLVLKLFPGDPIWTTTISGTPYLKKATEVSLLGGEARFLIGGLDYRRSLNPGNPIRIDERRAQRVTSTKKIMV